MNKLTKDIPWKHDWATHRFIAPSQIRNFTEENIRINENFPVSLDIKRMPNLHSDNGFVATLAPNCMLDKEHIQIIKCRHGFLHVVVCSWQINQSFNSTDLPENLKEGHVIWDSYLAKEHPTPEQGEGSEAFK